MTLPKRWVLNIFVRTFITKGRRDSGRGRTHPRTQILSLLLSVELPSPTGQAWDSKALHLTLELSCLLEESSPKRILEAIPATTTAAAPYSQGLALSGSENSVLLSARLALDPTSKGLGHTQIQMDKSTLFPKAGSPSM